MKDVSVDNSLAVTKAELDASIINETLDTLNSGQYSTSKKSNNTSDMMKESVDFQKQVLGAVYEDKGTIINNKS